MLVSLKKYGTLFFKSSCKSIIESLSLNCEYVLFCDKNIESIKTLKTNLSNLNISQELL